MNSSKRNAMHLASDDSLMKFLELIYSQQEMYDCDFGVKISSTDYVFIKYPHIDVPLLNFLAKNTSFRAIVVKFRDSSKGHVGFLFASLDHHRGDHERLDKQFHLIRRQYAVIRQQQRKHAIAFMFKDEETILYMNSAIGDLDLRDFEDTVELMRFITLSYECSRLDDVGLMLESATGKFQGQSYEKFITIEVKVSGYTYFRLYGDDFRYNLTRDHTILS